MICGMGDTEMMEMAFSRIIFLTAVMTSPFVSLSSSQAPTQNTFDDLPAKYMRLIRHYDQEGRYQKALATIHQDGIVKGRSFALIAGITFYPNMPKSSRYLRPAEVDLSKLESYLSEQELFDEIVVLKDEDFTYDNLSYFLGNYFPKQLSSFPNSRFLFAYTGHGYSETQGKHLKGYLVTSSASSTKDPVNRIDLSVLKTMLSSVVAEAEHTLVLINSCQSGAFIVRTSGGSGAINGHSAKVIMASRSNQSSFQLDDVGPGSVFFEKMFSGLAGPADKSPNDGIITYDELLTYLNDQIPNATGDNQIPKDGELDPDGSDGKFYFLNRGVQLRAGNLKDWKLGEPDAFDSPDADVYEEGLIALKSDDYEDAFRHFSHAASKGNVDAMMYLGFFYEQDLGTFAMRDPPSSPTASAEEKTKYRQTRDRDEKLSREWYKRAADGGNNVAMYHLAHAYEFGLGGQSDLNMARFWYEQAANKGFIYADFFVGLLYQEGRGGGRDSSKARSWYEKGAAAGDDQAMVALAKCYASGDGGQSDPKLAVYWYRKASELRNGEAMQALGLAYARGTFGLAQDFNEAERWFLRDSSTFRPFSFPSNVWELEEQGDEGGVRDYPDAKAHYERWAEQGNKMAMANLGFLYLHGLGVKKDVPKAMEFFEQAANGGNAYALYNLGTVYEKGDDGVLPNGNKALEFYRRADAGGSYQAGVALQRLGQLKTAR
jgi:uncharacterized protein